jgi:hypothetical protein
LACSRSSMVSHFTIIFWCRGHLSRRYRASFDRLN